MIEFILALIVTVCFSIFVVGAFIVGTMFDIDDYKYSVMVIVYFHAFILCLIAFAFILEVLIAFLSGDMQPFTTVYNQVFNWWW